MHRDVQPAEATLGGLLNFAGAEDYPRAGRQSGLARLDEGTQRGFELKSVDQFELSGALAPRKHQPLDMRELVGFSHLEGGVT